MNDEEWKLAQLLAEDEGTLQCLILVKYGVPFDVAMCLSEVQRFAYVVVFKQMYENIVFDWTSKRWKERSPIKQWGKL